MVDPEAMALKMPENGPTDPRRYDLAVQAGVENSFTSPSYRKCQPISTLRNVRANTCHPE